jgi:hypothetical protein
VLLVIEGGTARLRLIAFGRSFDPFRGECAHCDPFQDFFASQAEMQRGGSLREYLSTHFIFQPLSRHTTFIADLRAATGRGDLPDQVIWQPDGL